jgi:endo-1,4-beta-xylanase
MKIKCSNKKKYLKRSDKVIIRITTTASIILIFFSLLSCGSSTQVKDIISDQSNKNLKALSNVYKDYFPIGVAVSERTLNIPEVKHIIKTNFNSITAEGAMKPKPLLQKNGKYMWKESDVIVAFAKENNMKIRGHTLVWHLQTPDWFFQDKYGENLAKDRLYLKLHDYMSTVINHFKDVNVWDVVNEAVSNEYKLPNIYREKDSKWFQICGKEYIEKAFRMAHAIDPTKKLFYNDFDLIQKAKQDKTYTMLKNLLDKGVPIYGLGMQAHWHVDTDPKKIEAAIKRFASLGLEIHITELDVSLVKWNEKIEGEDFIFTKEDEEKQAKSYASFFEVFRKHKDIVTSVSFWGVSDKNSWLNNYPVKGKNYPLLFDGNYSPKKSFYSIIEKVE